MPSRKPLSHSQGKNTPSYDQLINPKVLQVLRRLVESGVDILDAETLSTSMDSRLGARILDESTEISSIFGADTEDDEGNTSMTNSKLLRMTKMDLYSGEEE